MFTGLKISSLPCKCIFCRPEQTTEREPHGTDFYRFWNAKIKYYDWYSSKSSNGVIILVYSWSYGP